MRGLRKDFMKIEISRYTREEIMDSEYKHYARNQINILPSDELAYYQNNDEWFHETEDTYHRMGIEKDVEVHKFVSLFPNEFGMYEESVFHDGVLLILSDNSPNSSFINKKIDPVNAGTINYATSKSNLFKHIEMDINPFLKHGNTAESLEMKNSSLHEKFREGMGAL